MRDIEASGKTPLQFLIDNMRNEKLDANVRIDCAKAALPYLHPRAVTTVNVDAMLQITELCDVIVDPKAAEVIEHEVVKEALRSGSPGPKPDKGPGGTSLGPGAHSSLKSGRVIRRPRKP